jgi:hypothetical protein
MSVLQLIESQLIHPSTSQHVSAAAIIATLGVCVAALTHTQRADTNAAQLFQHSPDFHAKGPDCSMVSGSSQFFRCSIRRSPSVRLNLVCVWGGGCRCSI